MKKYFLIVMLAAIMYAGSESNFRFAVVGDRTGSCVPGVFPETIDEVKLFDPDFVMCVGDLIHGYTSDTMSLHAQWDTFITFVEKLPCKFYYAAGNHDIQNEVDRQIYENRTGFKRYYSFDYKNSHFIILDNTMTYWAQPQEMDKEQIAWLKKDLKKNKRKDNIFVFYHIPTYLYALRADTSDMLVEIFEEYGVDMVFTGHHHEYSYINRNKIEYINVGSSGGGMGDMDFARGHFYHYLMITVKGKKHEVAVIRKGSTFLRNVVTAEDLLLVARADTEAIQIEPFIAKTEMKNISQNFTLSVNNFGPDSINQTLKWNFDSKRYDISPAELPIAIGSDEEKKFKCNLTIRDGSDIYPIPQCVLVYPFTYGKACTVRGYMPIKCHKDVKRIRTAPVVDGKLKEAAWGRVKPITHLATYDGQPDPPVEKTEVYLCHDEINLYLGVRCFESDFSKLKADATEHDGQSPFDDNLWFFFDTNFDKETYYQAIINSNGVVFDRACSLKDGKSDKNIAWDGPWEIATGREHDAWVLEIKIPKEKLEPYDKKQWGLNFRRLQPRPSLNDAGYWSLPFGHDPANFGIIEFE